MTGTSVGATAGVAIIGAKGLLISIAVTAINEYISKLKVVSRKKVFNNLEDKRKKQKPKVRLENLVRTADIDKTFSKVDTINWSYMLYKITTIIGETIPTYHIDFLPQRYNSTVLKKS